MPGPSGHPELVVYDLALAQFDETNTPTVLVPVVFDGVAGVFYASYEGDAGWMDQARDPEQQTDLAIACCKRAYADALARCGAVMPAPGGRPSS